MIAFECGICVVFEQFDFESKILVILKVCRSIFDYNRLIFFVFVSTPACAIIALR